MQLDPAVIVYPQGHLSLLRDPEGRLDATEAAAAPGWRALPGAVNAGYTTDTVWLRTSVQRPADGPARWQAEFSNALLDDVRLYQQDAAGRWQEVQHAGEREGRTHWPVDARNVQLPLTLDSEMPTPLLLRLQSQNALSTTLAFATPEVHGNAARREYLFYGLGFGFGLLLVAFHALFWQMTRERLSAWYLLYVSNALLVEFMTAGLPQQLLAMPMWLSDLVLSLAMCAGLAIGAPFALMQLGADLRWPRFTRFALRAVATLSAAATALVLSGHNGAGMLAVQWTAMLCIVLLIGAALWLLPRDAGQARSFLLIFGVYYVGVGISFVRNLGWLPANVWTQHAAALGTLLHMLLMSMRLNRRYDMLRREKESAQARIVRMVGKHNDRLEREVRRRTADLRQEIERRQGLERDLRAALETERQARQSQLDFVALVSHEFRTPLAIINTTAQQIARNLEAAREKTLSRCMNLRAAAQRMAALVDEYLTADRMDAGRAPFRPRVCEREELRELLEDLVADWPDGRIVLDDGGVPSRVDCDPGLLRVALRNLLANADRHAPPGRRIDLQAAPGEQGGMCIRVSNPGEQIPAADSSRLFEKYFRGRQAVRSPGAGLGLYLVLQIAELHGGQARLESAGQDGHVRFSLTLP